ncbi:MAG TPA: hypothetical protein VK325_08625, partial [Pseudoxanthomonas sp.]|nr:hypothetical protein [Pseudoxanthomonas sp.]
DTPLADPTQPKTPWSFQCIANAIGCVLSETSAPTYATYSLRLQDAEARQKLVSTWLWLRDQADRSLPLQQRLASRPDEFKSPSRGIEVVDGGKALQIRMYETSQGETWKLPLPE